LYVFDRKTGDTLQGKDWKEVRAEDQQHSLEEFQQLIPEKKAHMQVCKGECLTRIGTVSGKEYAAE
jgi:hypothetical protein